MKPILFTTLLVSLSAALLGSVHADITIPTVTVGDPGNANDPFNFSNTGSVHGNLYGGVAYTYAIGTTEVTLTQYTGFLNAVAQTDTYGLYNAGMTDPTSAGISQAGSSGSYTYAVLGSGARPVTYVSWYDAARFTNWLHNGQPVGLQVAGTTEDGAYTLAGNTGLIAKNANATFWIPSEHEWYKVAYYQPAAAGGDAPGYYWAYPTKTDTAPTNNLPGAGANRGNFNNGVYATTQSASYSATENYLTEGGAYTDSSSYYGTFDQGGNVWEWNDAIISQYRGRRGGTCYQVEGFMKASSRYTSLPDTEHHDIGFRIATVPEPTASVSLILGVGMLLARRKSPSAL